MRSKFSTFFKRYKEYFTIEDDGVEGPNVTDFYFSPKTDNIQFKMNGEVIVFGHFRSDKPSADVPESVALCSATDRSGSWSYELDGDVVANWTLVELNPRKIA